MNKLKLSNEITRIKLILITVITLLVVCLLLLVRILPQLQEEYVSIQTIKLNGEIYVCGTEINNKDNESLYCRGFTDGHNWAIQQMNIDKELNK